MKCDRENTVFGKKFDMFYYFVCTTQYITDTKQKNRRKIKGTVQIQLLTAMYWLFIADI